MRFMVIMKATPASEAGEMPSERVLTAMGQYNEELVKAGILLAGEGLHPSRGGARIPNPDGDTFEIELRQVFEMEDFGAEMTPDVRAQETRLRAELDATP